MPGDRALWIILTSLIGLLCCTDQVQAGRLFGSSSFSYEHIRQENEDVAQDDLTRESLILSYEDALFVKNRLRLTANLQRREFAFSTYHEFRPIYLLNLKSTNYSFDLRHSPYTQRASRAGTGDEIEIHYREWRFNGQLSYPKWPSLGVVLTRLSSFDDEAESEQNSYSRNLVLETGYTVGPVSLRGNYSNLRQVSNLNNGPAATTKTYSSTLDFSQAVSGIGYFSSAYNYYNTERVGSLGTGLISFTHSVSSMATLSPVTGLSANLGYSGRFTESELGGRESGDDNQNLSARLDVAPASFATFFTAKGYQVNSRDVDDDVVEYLTLGATLTRYLRRGADMRLTVGRTVYQQSTRFVPVRDSAGNVIGTIEDGDYILDTYNASFSFDPWHHVTMHLDLTLTHDSDPGDEDRRYQLSRSLDARLKITRRLEGRVAVSALYQGEALRLNRAFSDQYNVGFTYIPSASLNFNVTYIYSRFNGAVRSRQGSFTGYVSYSYRRAFTTYVSLNQRVDKREGMLPGFTEPTEVETRPRSTNAQLLAYLSRRITLSTAYLFSRNESILGQEIKNESIQVVLTVQI